jgi:hypothetical protein
MSTDRQPPTERTTARILLDVEERVALLHDLFLSSRRDTQASITTLTLELQNLPARIVNEVCAVNHRQIPSPTQTPPPIQTLQSPTPHTHPAPQDATSDNVSLTLKAPAKALFRFLPWVISAILALLAGATQLTPRETPQDNHQEVQSGEAQPD